MRVYRSIGDSELQKLMNEEIIEGKYCSFKPSENIIKTNDLKSAVCFFTERFRWKDAEHKIFLEVEIPDKELSFGIGIYYAAKNLMKTKTWSGRRGSTRYELNEAYTKEYDSSNVRAIYFGDRYANWFQEKVLEWAKKYGILVLENF